MADVLVYSKNTCVTCKKAKAFLDEHGITYQEQDIIKNPPSREVLEQLIEPQNVKASLNSRSTLYKEKNLGKQVPDKAEAIRLMLQDPNLIKRPVLLRGQTRLQGFDPAQWDQLR